MTEKRKLSRYFILYRAMQTALLTGICMEAAGKFLDMEGMGILHGLFAAAWIAVLLGLNYCKVRGKLICGGIVCIVLLFTFFWFGREQIGAFFQGCGKWLLGQPDFAAEWKQGYILILAIPVVIGCYLFQVITEKYEVTKELAGGALLAGLLAALFFHVEISHLFVTFIIWYLVLCYIEGTQRRWKKKKAGDHRIYLMWISAFCVLYAVFLCLSPSPEEPYDWRFVKEAYAELRENFTIWMQKRANHGQEDFGIAFAGFSESGRLMGNVMGSSRELLTVQGGQGLRTNIYLSGKTYDTFNGRQWEQTITENTGEHQLDTLETLYAIERYDEGNRDAYLYGTGLSLRYQYMNTGYLFAPLKLRSVRGCEYQESGANLVFGEKRGYGTSYQLTYFQLNVDSPEFYQMAESEMKEDEEAWRKVIRTYTPNGEKRYTMEELKAYRQTMYEKYYHKTALSPELKDYLARITEDCDTTIEKLRAIEAELSSYTYTKNPGRMPDAIDTEEEFLEYFLLEKKEGYCSYFATAFVLLARAEGLPARYVEGFCIPSASAQEMTVTSNMVHAWPEVYLQGIGWVPFEPTPGYAEIRYTPWKTGEGSGKLHVSGAAVEETEEEDEKDLESLSKTTEQENEQEAEIEHDRMIRLLLLGMLAVAAMALLILFAEQLLFRQRLRKMSTEERYLLEIRRNFWILNRLGCTRKETETLEELCRRIPVGTFLQDYQDYLYGGRRITEEMLKTVQTQRVELLEKWKQRRRWYSHAAALGFWFVR